MLLSHQVYGADGVPAPLVERQALLDEAYRIRMVVFVDEQQVPVDEERDDYDEDAVHCLVLEGGTPLATARLVVKPGGVAKIGRVAVLEAARGKGLGRLVMLALHGEAQRLGLTACLLDAQVQVRGFYEGLGYIAEGELFLDAGIWHQRMSRPVAPDA